MPKNWVELSLGRESGPRHCLRSAPANSHRRDIVFRRELAHLRVQAQKARPLPNQEHSVFHRTGCLRLHRELGRNIYCRRRRASVLGFSLAELYHLDRRKTDRKPRRDFSYAQGIAHPHGASFSPHAYNSHSDIGPASTPLAPSRPKLRRPSRVLDFYRVAGAPRVTRRPQGRHRPCSNITVRWILRPKQSMTPTAAFRNKFSVFATTPYPSLSLFR